jgi:hypothetical protein
MGGARPSQSRIAWGYNDRPAFGYLATRQAFLARTWRPPGPVLPVAIRTPSAAPTNVTSTYLAAGFDVVSVPGEARPKRGGGGWNAKRDPWDNPNSGEDKSLRALRGARGHSGWWLAEVPVGARPPRRLDAVVVPWPGPRCSRAGQDVNELREVVAGGAEVEVVEAKKSLDDEAIGQLLSGARTAPGCSPTPIPSTGD